MCPYGKAVEQNSHAVVGECGIYKGEQDVSRDEENRQSDMDKFGTLDSSEKNDRYPRRQMVATDGETARR